MTVSPWATLAGRGAGLEGRRVHARRAGDERIARRKRAARQARAMQGALRLLPGPETAVLGR
jgi:hypothetical protein